MKCPHCLEEISKGATRCKWCTSELDPESVLPAPNMGKEVPAKISKKDKVRLGAWCPSLMPSAQHGQIGARQNPQEGQGADLLCIVPHSGMRGSRPAQQSGSCMQ